MNPDQSPFTDSTPFKRVPYEPDGDFDWLRNTSTHGEWAIGDRQREELPAQLKSAVLSAKSHGVSLPASFVRFLSDQNLHKHLRSVNGDYLRVANNLLPFGEGYLLRFLSDQQNAIHWYLYLNSNGSDHCVVASFEYFDADRMDYEPDEVSESDFQFASESFEWFFARYWIEHEVMFARHDGTPLPDIDPQILKLYVGHEG